MNRMVFQILLSATALVAVALSPLAQVGDSLAMT
jgi:hypothetical protein